MDSGFISREAIIGMVVAFLVGLAVAIAVGGLLLRLAVQWIGRFTPGYWRCVGVVLAAGVVGATLNFALAAVLRFGTPQAAIALGGGMPGMGAAIAYSLVGFAIAVVVNALAVQLLLRPPEGGTLPFARALGIAAAYVGMGLALYFACIAVLLVLLGGVPGVAR